MATGCCLQSDADGAVSNAMVTAIGMNMWSAVYRGERGTENFKGHLSDSIGSLRSLRSFAIHAAHTSGTFPAGLIESTSLEYMLVWDVLIAGASLSRVVTLHFHTFSHSNRNMLIHPAQAQFLTTSRATSAPSISVRSNSK